MASGGASAILGLALALLLGAVTYAVLMHNHNNKQPSGYTCTNGVCVEEDGGIFQSAELCHAQCNKSTTPCTCEHGTPADGCTSEGEKRCKEPCDDGYWLSGFDCVANVCTCPKGTPAKGAACTRNGATVCAACDDGSTPNSQGTCGPAEQPQACTCENGATQSKDCTPSNPSKCDRCDTGYTLASNACIKNTCTCTNGVGASGAQCPVSGAETCVKCNAGYKLQGTQCVSEDPPASTCTCSNGSPQTGSGCPSGGGNVCKSCDEGYVLSGTQCVPKSGPSPKGCVDPGNMPSKPCTGCGCDAGCAMFDNGDGKCDCRCNNQGKAADQSACASDIWHAQFTSDDDGMTLCPNSLECGGILVKPEDMDQLAQDIANGKQKSRDALNAAGVRYIERVVKGNCSAYPDVMSNTPGLWELCQNQDACTLKSSKVFGGKPITSVEGCMWWGRGVIQTSGPCNFGDLNAALQKLPKYQDEHGKPKFNLCLTPELICNTKAYPELKWIGGFFYWVSMVQNYVSDDKYTWSYHDALQKAESSTGPTSLDFVSFINACSGLVNRGCPAINCDAGAVDHDDFRRTYTESVWGIMDGDTITDADKFNSVVLKMDRQDATTPYNFEGFREAYEFATETGFYGDDSGKFVKSKANLATFLGQCMQETLKYGACDENNWSETSLTPQMATKVCSTAQSEEICTNYQQHPQYGICKWNGSACVYDIYPDGMQPYPMTTACGQLGQVYSEYKCSATSNKCDVGATKDRTVVGRTHQQWPGAPGPLFSTAVGSNQLDKIYMANLNGR